ncbi:MAG: hypothetical protein V2B20_17220 [Pseudomonadota bacterium]
MKNIATTTNQTKAPFFLREDERFFIFSDFGDRDGMVFFTSSVTEVAGTVCSMEILP